MPDRIVELRERMAKTKKEADVLLAGVADRDGRMTSEERETYDRMVADLTAWGETYERLVDSERAQMAGANDPPPTDGDAAGDGDGAGDGTETTHRARPPVVPVDVTQPVGEFRDFGDFVAAALGGSDARIIRYAAATRELSMGIGEEGGILIPEQWAQTIMMVDPETELVRPLATSIPPTDPPDAALSFPTLKQGASGAMGGVTFEWVAEGGDKPETDYDLEGVKTEPQEFAAHVVITDKLLRNSQAAAVFLRRILNMGVGQSVDTTLIKGNGIGKPTGVWLAAAAIEIARNTSSDFKFADVCNMLAAILPESWGRAVWALHQTLLPKVVNLADAAGNSIFIAGDARKKISPSLLGIPIRWTGKTYALGTRGDAALMDFSYYLYRQGAGPFIAASEHVYFLKNKTVVKAFGSCDGQPWLKEPLTLDDGSTQVSPFVILKA